MGIPIIDVVGNYNFVQTHPFWAAFVFTLLVALVSIGVWFTRKYPKHKGKLRLAIFTAYVGVAAPMVWAAFEPQPSQYLEMFEKSHRQEIIRSIESAVESDKVN